MKPASHAQRHFSATKLLMVDRQARIHHGHVADLSRFLKKGDLLVVNRSGTMPASFRGKIGSSGEAVEIRLASFRGATGGDLSRWMAVSFGSGDWRVPTESRGPAPRIVTGDVIDLHPDLVAQVGAVDPRHARLFEIQFSSSQLVRRLFEVGRPIQYSYLREELKVWDQQTLFAGPAVSVEPPSASFPLDWEQVFQLRGQGVEVAAVLHGAGLSSTGDPHLDADFPLAEYFEIPSETLEQIRQCRLRGGRVVALGTSVVRAIESAHKLKLQKGYTSLILDGKSRLQNTDILITGMHEVGTSHARLMLAFCGLDLLDKIVAESGAYSSHEYGDLTLLERSGAR